MIPCSLIEVYLHFIETYCLHLQGRRVRPRRKQRLLAVCLFGVLFDFEDGGSTFLRNAGKLCHTLYNHRRENLKSHKTDVPFYAL
jgi:hypothetical protein